MGQLGLLVPLLVEVNMQLRTGLLYFASICTLFPSLMMLLATDGYCCSKLRMRLSPSSKNGCLTLKLRVSKNSKLSALITSLSAYYAFENFLKKREIDHEDSVAYHPQQNGVAE